MLAGLKNIVTEYLESRRLFAADLLMDAAGLNPAEAVTVNHQAYFFADNGVVGKELWTSDGTATGTKLISDLTPGKDSTDATKLYAIGNTILFFTQTPSTNSFGEPANDYKLIAFNTVTGDLNIQKTFSDLMMVTTCQTDKGLFYSVNWRVKYANQLQDSASLYLAGPESSTLLHTFVPDEFTSVLVNQIKPGSNGNIIFWQETDPWCSDGTPEGTVELTPIIESAREGIGGTSLLSYGAVEGGVAFIPWEANIIWISDGTIAGTSSHPISTEGKAESLPSYANGKFFFTTTKNLAGEDARQLVVYSFDLTTFQTTEIYRDLEFGFDHDFSFTQFGNKVYLRNDARSNNTAQSHVLISDGTVNGTSEISNENLNQTLLSSAVVNGVLYYVNLVRGTKTNSNLPGGQIGTFVDDEGSAMSTDAREGDRVELLSTDGTEEGTHLLRTILDSGISGNTFFFSLRTAHDRLVLYTETGDVGSQQFGPDHTKEATVFDPHELLPGRQAMTVRLVNGNLRINGSVEADDVKVFRLRTDPDKLVVQFNGNQRRFNFSDVRRITADLQSGDDQFQIIEGTSGMIRLRTQVTGGDGNDFIATASAPDSVIGGAGNDRIYGGRGNDIINGNSGNDRINGQSGSDFITGGIGRDRIRSGVEADVLFGARAIEYAFGQDVENETLASDVLIS